MSKIVDLAFEYVPGSNGERATLVDLSKKGRHFLFEQWKELTVGELCSMPTSKSMEISQHAVKNACVVTMNGDTRW